MIYVNTRKDGSVVTKIGKSDEEDITIGQFEYEMYLLIKNVLLLEEPLVTEALWRAINDAATDYKEERNNFFDQRSQVS